MIGITSFSAYIPRLRLNRQAIAQSMGWYAPALQALAKGERSFCNHDEDSLTMAVAAACNCIQQTDKQNISSVYLCSTTLPFADRQNATILSTALNLREDLVNADLTSCLKAGTTGLITALGIAKSKNESILVVATDKREAKPASPYEMYFGDGAAAMLVGMQNVIAEFVDSYSISCDFVDHYRGTGRIFDYTWEERWIKDEGYGRIIPAAVAALLKKQNISPADIDKFIFPCVFKAERLSIAKKIGATPEKIIDNLHDSCGEAGAAHPLLMLAYALETAKAGEKILVASFGQGCDALLFQVTDKIKNNSSRITVNQSLTNKKTINDYCKFLTFRGLMPVEEGIRAEAPNQTALSTLWRNRKMIMGLVGGKCRQCGTPQYPLMDICVNPDCGALHSQDDYEFADIPAVVKTFTGDMLAASAEPPAISGIIQFAGGGRFMVDFTDCELKDIKVGMRVQMVWRRKLLDRDRGFSGYFWKAVPKMVNDRV
jgi:3-hydroxy-3-methylglutaryl CoA synthase